MKKLLTLPNLLTALRIAGAVCMIFMPPLTQAFFIIYTLCGVSDVLDGTIARARHSESDFGARLDSIADLLFYAVMLLRIFPVLWERLPRVIWLLVAIVLLMRAASYITAAVKYRRFASLHTLLNKLTGFGVFMIPYQALRRNRFRCAARHRLLLCRLRHRISRLGGGATDTHSLPGVHPRSHVPV